MKHIVVLLTVSFALLLSCATTTAKKFYILNYQPETLTNRLSQNPWPCTIRVRDFSIEGAYARNQIVYRRSPYELEYYFYHNWAVKPSSMLTDIVRRHLQAVNLVNNVILRYDEGTMPDYELSGTISSIEEYDSETAWFAHLAFSVKLTRMAKSVISERAITTN